MRNRRAPSQSFRTRRIFGGILLTCIAVAAARAQSNNALFVPEAPLPIGRHMHGAAVLGDYLYVFGGALAGTGWTPSVLFAPIQSDGSLGAWTETTPLPENRHYIACSTVALNDVIYIVGGKEGVSDKYRNTAYWAKPGPDGHLSPWVETAPFGGEGLAMITVTSTPGYMHLIGGLNDAGQPSAAVTSGRIDPDGGIRFWEQGPVLPTRLWWHHAAAVGGKVWIWSGLPTGEYKPILNSVFSSAIQRDGRLAAWEQEASQVPAYFFGGITATAGPYLFTFCPRRGLDDVTDEVWYNRVENKTLAGWSPPITTGLPNRIYFALAPDYRRGTIYVTGGKPSRGKVPPDPQVFRFRLSRQASTTPEPTPPPMAAAQGAPTPVQYSYQALSRVSPYALPGFLSFEDARRQAATPPGHLLILYFHSENATKCREQKQMLPQGVQSLAGQTVFGWIDVADSPQLAQQLGIFRVPTWVLFNRLGQPLGMNYGALTLDQIAQAVARNQ